MYPHQEGFENWCRGPQRLSPKSVENADYCLSHFFAYAAVNFPSSEVNDITASNVRDYLQQLASKEKLQVTTVNKYVSYIKKYFYYLALAGITPTYRLLDLKGYSFERRKTYVIGWPDHLPDLVPCVKQPLTLWLMQLFALGYQAKELLSVRYSDVKDDLGEMSDYLTGSLSFENSPDPYVFASRSGEPYASSNNIMQLVKADKDLLSPMPLTLTNLRLSYVYSLISQQKYSDKELLEILRCPPKRLAYYQYNAAQCNLIRFSAQMLKKQGASDAPLKK
ncbi:integrase [Lactobacillus nasalidis]|uniref:Integrase n=1 Tax=Lactobacillus nasalidis TaxID=2797258 RepID=A0ABQ3W7S6_9LACO|nr:site-specific integrase [Lactobacillus nasalidis]GHV97131.1 integrase [Lactobacillus nasalidis]GHV99118.1 integrase [Lactobacillus nasalidis]GHW01410.1 integrase [Lactobacillus nasalidis]